MRIDPRTKAYVARRTRRAFPKPRSCAASSATSPGSSTAPDFATLPAHRACRRRQRLDRRRSISAYNPKIPAARIRDLATLGFVTVGESIVLHGPVGVGKSHVAQALGHAACRRGLTVAFTKTSRLLGDLAGGHADRSWEARLRRWARPAVLILDDFAMREFTVTQADDLYELISERADRSLIITANRAAEDWYSLFPNPVVAESILDRLVNRAHHIAMPGRSYRPNRRPGQERR